MSRTVRLFDLLQALRRYRMPVSGAQLAEETGISLRTLYRDIAALQAMGAEIDGEPGLGYVMKPGFTLPPLMFSEEETEALALGLKWVSRRADDEMSSAAREALAKVAAVLPPELRLRLEDSSLIVGPGWDKPQTVALKVLRKAIQSEQKIRIDYRDAKGAASTRTVWPVALSFFESTRVLVAWCELREGFRHFRADRIMTATVLERYPRRRHALLQEWQKILLTESDTPSPYPCCSTQHTKDNEMEAEIVFYTNPWSRGGIVHWMLEEIGVPYQMETLEYGPAMKSPDYLAINPMGKVPAIRHGNVVVTEAAAICAYLADAFPEAGLAPPLDSRGDYYRWLFFAAGPLESALSFKQFGFEPDPEQQAQLGFGSCEATVKTLANAIKGRRYIAGDRFSAADIYVGSHIGWGMEFGTLERSPEFEAYWAGLKDRPAHKRVAESVPAPDATEAGAKA